MGKKQGLESRKAPLTKREIFLKREERAKAFFLFACLLSLLLKFFLPLFLKSVAHLDKSLTEIDFFLFLPLLGILYSTVFSHKKQFRSALLLSCFFYSLYELVLFSQGRLHGMDLFYKVFSSLPLGFGALAYYSTMDNRNRFQADWLWAFLASTSFITSYEFFHFWETRVPQRPLPVSSSQETKAQQPLSIKPEEKSLADLCGLMDVRMNSIHKDQWNVPVERITFDDCGLKPAGGVVSRGRILIENISEQTLNLRFMLSREKSKNLQLAWNLVLRPHSKMLTPEIRFERKQRGVLLSDSLPTAGIVALVDRADNFEEVTFSREPLSISEKGVQP